MHRVFELKLNFKNMVQSFFRIAFRFLWRNKTYTILNFFCLTFGLTCAIIAALNVTRVLNYDRFHKNYKKLYAVEAGFSYFNGTPFPKEYLSASLTDILKRNVPEIESVSRITTCDYVINKTTESFSEKGIYADPEFMDIFTFPVAAGQPIKVLSGNNSILISERLAYKIFQTTECIGQTLMLKNNSGEEGFTITGVLMNIPSQSYLQFDFIIPFSKYLAANKQALETGANACQFWVLLHANADISDVNAKLKTLISNKETTLNQELFLFPLSEKILYTYNSGRRVWREMWNIVIFGCLGFAILLISCFNFINLAIAQNVRRYREAGIKKVIGAQRSSIILQHLGETLIITLISLFFAIELVRIAVVGLNRALNGNVQFNYNDIGLILIFAGIAIFTALFSGLLPALYLSSSNPLNVLKGRIATSHSFSSLRQSLIVFQFTIPIVLIIVMIIIKAQDGYLRKYDLGFDKNSLMIIHGSKEVIKHSESIRTDMLSIPGIESVSFSNSIPARGARISDEVTWAGKSATEKMNFWCIDTDYSFGKTVNLKISDGRFFDESFPSDSASFLINDVAAKLLGYEKTVGRTLTLGSKKGSIIGIFRDFRVNLAGPPVPVIISIAKEAQNIILVKFSPDVYSDISNKIKIAIAVYEPDVITQPILYRDFAARTELTTMSNLIGLAFFIAILLGCLGLFGLTSFTTANRTREIGIRKINGATVLSIMQLLGLKYSKWLMIASVIALPLAFLIGNIFLARFSLRIPMPYWAFLAGPGIAYLVAISTFTGQCLKASTRNPADALRYE